MIRAILAGLLTAVVALPVTFFLVLFLAGPHSDVLPNGVAPLVILLGWLTAVGGPILVARKVYRRKPHSAEPSQGMIP